MRRRLVVESGPGQCRGGLIEDGVLVELLIARESALSLVGARFRARIERVMPSLPGAFLDLGADHGRGFLPGETRHAEGTAILVEIVKDAFDGKPPECTEAWSVADALLAYTPARPGIAVSRRLDPAARATLSARLAELVRPGEGIVARTEAAGADPALLGPALDRLRMEAARIEALFRSSTVPGRLGPAPSLLEALLRTLPVPVEEIVVDDAALAVWREHARPAMILLDPALVQAADLDGAIDQALAPVLRLDNGARVTIEKSAAMTVIDVDLGGLSIGRAPARAAILEANRAAATEAARQIRLRNLAGSMVIDFISMRHQADRDEVRAVLAAALAPDPMESQILGWTRLGHLELTRRRTRAALADLLAAPVARPSRSPETVALDALRAVSRLKPAGGGLVLAVAPPIATLLAGPMTPLLARAASACGRAVTLRPDPARDPETFEIAPLST